MSFLLSKKTLSRIFPIGKRYFSYPPHKVIGLPALSPTMTSGNIAKWSKKEGDKLSPGDAIADVETDKTTVTLEALDENYIAKILVAEGTEIAVGAPVMITVEEEEFVTKFADYKTTSAPVAAAAPVSPPPPPPVSAPAKPPTSPPPVAEPVKTAAPTPVSKPATAPAPAPPSKPATAPSAPPKAPTSTDKQGGVVSVIWGTGVVKSGLAAKLAGDQQDYVKKYGNASHIPLQI